MKWRQAQDTNNEATRREQSYGEVTLCNNKCTYVNVHTYRHGSGQFREEANEFWPKP